MTLYLGAFLALLRRRWTLGAVLCTLALLTKAIAVTLPVMLLIYAGVFRDRTRSRILASSLSDWRRLALPVLLPGLLVAASLVYRALLLPAWAAQTRQESWVTPWLWCMSQWSALLYYVRLFLWPDALSVDHDFAYTTSLFAPRAWVSLLVLLAWVALTLRAAKRQPHVLFATAWFFVTLAPESSFVPLAEVINEHRPYIATALGLSVLLTWVLYRAAALLPASTGTLVFTAACVLLCIPAVVVNHDRSWQWSDALRLWEDTVHTSPNNGRAWMNTGLEYLRRGDLTAARHAFERARQLVPGYAYVYMNLSVLEAQEGHLGRALSAAQEAVRLSPGLALTHVYLGHVLKKTGRTAEAAMAYRRAVELDPRYAEAQEALAQVGARDILSEEAMMQIGLDALYTRRDPDTAAAQFRKVLERHPTHYGATFQLALALDRAGKPSAARPLWEQVLTMAEGYNDEQTAATARARLQQGQ